MRIEDQYHSNTSVLTNVFRVIHKHRKYNPHYPCALDAVKTVCAALSYKVRTICPFCVSQYVIIPCMVTICNYLMYGQKNSVLVNVFHAKEYI